MVDDRSGSCSHARWLHACGLWAVRTEVELWLVSLMAGLLISAFCVASVSLSVLWTTSRKVGGFGNNGLHGIVPCSRKIVINPLLCGYGHR